MGLSGAAGSGFQSGFGCGGRRGFTPIALRGLIGSRLVATVQACKPESCCFRRLLPGAHTGSLHRLCVLSRSAFLLGLGGCSLVLVAMPLGAAPLVESPSSVLAAGTAVEPQVAERLPSQHPPVLIGVPASPAAVDKVPGTGALGRWLGIPADSPWRLGGFWAGNATSQLGGGLAHRDDLGLANQFLLDLSLDLQKSVGWPGAKLWVQGLQANANPAAATTAGSLQGANSLVSFPLNNTQLFSYALSQFLFDEQVRLLVGKLAPGNDFANVVVPVAEASGSPYSIPGMSSLTYTPLYAMPTLFGRLNTALGASLLVQPKVFNRDVYLKLGVFDGRGGSGVNPQVQTGLSLPSLSGPLFSIAEIGGAWTVGSQSRPGAGGFGLWHQGGPLGCSEQGSSCEATGAAGGYLIAQQRLINFRYPRDSSGVSTFVQAGWTPSTTNQFTASVGGGLTLFAPMRSRPRDSYGVGLAWARINQHGPLAPAANPTELMLQVYGQVHLAHNLYLTPSITVLPRVGVRDALAPSTTALLNLVALF